MRSPRIYIIGVLIVLTGFLSLLIAIHAGVYQSSSRDLEIQVRHAGIPLSLDDLKWNGITALEQNGADIWEEVLNLAAILGCAKNPDMMAMFGKFLDIPNDKKFIYLKENPKVVEFVHSQMDAFLAFRNLVDRGKFSTDLKRMIASSELQRNATGYTHGMLIFVQLLANIGSAEGDESTLGEALMTLARFDKMLSQAPVQCFALLRSTTRNVFCNTFAPLAHRLNDEAFLELLVKTLQQDDAQYMKRLIEAETVSSWALLQNASPDNLPVGYSITGPLTFRLIEVNKRNFLRTLISTWPTLMPPYSQELPKLARTLSMREPNDSFAWLVSQPIDTDIKLWSNVWMTNDLALLAVACRRFYLSQGRSPSDLEELTRKGYIEYFPKGPFSGSVYRMASSQDGVVTLGASSAEFDLRFLCVSSQAGSFAGGLVVKAQSASHEEEAEK